MIAHNAADPGRVDQARRETVRRGLTLVIPVAVVLALGAPLVLALFGPRYVATGTGALALVALSAIPNVITAATISTARVRQRQGVQFGVPTSLSVLTIGLAWLLMPHLGVLAVGLAWLLAQCSVAAVVLITNAPWVPGPPGRWIDAIRSSALLRRVGQDGLRRVGAPADWAIGSHMAGGSETVVVTIGPAGSAGPCLRPPPPRTGNSSCASRPRRWPRCTPTRDYDLDTAHPPRARHRRGRRHLLRHLLPHRDPDARRTRPRRAGRPGPPRHVPVQRGQRDQRAAPAHHHPAPRRRHRARRMGARTRSTRSPAPCPPGSGTKRAESPRYWTPGSVARSSGSAGRTVTTCR